MNKLICIVGSTGTGKTGRAVELAKQQPNILVSADSRQVYRGMDIVTGKDHPKDIKIFGIDIVNPDESCSVAVWYDSVMPHIKLSWELGETPIIVGGTGLYIKALTDGIETMQVPINQSLRDELILLSITELQDKLKEINLSKFESMNNSDQQNPRRLIRAIEITNNPEKLQSYDLPAQAGLCKSKAEIIGLRCPIDSDYQTKIRERVISRLDLGAIEETKLLLAKYDKSIQSMSAIGYKSIIRYLEGSCTEEEMIDNWVDDEVSYAKRQMTWFRKQPVIWYDVTYGSTKN